VNHNSMQCKHSMCKETPWTTHAIDLPFRSGDFRDRAIRGASQIVTESVAFRSAYVGGSWLSSVGSNVHYLSLLSCSQHTHLRPSAAL
jgi:hypothetical protein